MGIAFPPIPEATTTGSDHASSTFWPHSQAKANSVIIDIFNSVRAQSLELGNALGDSNTRLGATASSAKPSDKVSICLCLNWSAGKLATESFDAAILFHKRRFPNEVAETWNSTQQTIMKKVLAATWVACSIIRAKTGPVFDKFDHKIGGLPCEEYEKGHVQPWMRAEIMKTIRDAVLDYFAELGEHTMMQPRAASYRSFSFDKLDCPYNGVDRTKFTCLCKDDRVSCEADRGEIHR